jgi:hypothetical protein
MILIFNHNLLVVFYDAKAIHDDGLLWMLERYL